jgi:hypothetical protein
VSNGIVSIVIINVAAGVFGYLMGRLHPGMGRGGFLGYYLVLMPLGFAIRDDASLWGVAGFVVVGLVLITFAARRATPTKA